MNAKEFNYWVPWKVNVLFFYYYYTLRSEVHVQNVQVCYIGIHVPWWFTAPINLSSTLDSSPNAIPALASYTPAILPLTPYSLTGTDV